MIVHRGDMHPFIERQRFCRGYIIFANSVTLLRNSREDHIAAIALETEKQYKVIHTIRSIEEPAPSGMACCIYLGFQSEGIRVNAKVGDRRIIRAVKIEIIRSAYFGQIRSVIYRCNRNLRRLARFAELAERFRRVVQMIFGAGGFRVSGYPLPVSESSRAVPIRIGYITDRYIAVKHIHRTRLRVFRSHTRRSRCNTAIARGRYQLR